MANFKEEVAQIRAFVFDVDGVFTNCKVMIDAQGNYLREYNMRDALAVVRALEKGYPIAIISGGEAPQLRQAMSNLGVEYLYLGAGDKREPLLDFSKQCGIPLREMVYIGDDYNDITAMKMVRIAVAPSDAAADIKALSHYVSAFGGGAGCVRDIIEQVMRARCDWYTVE